MDVFVCFASLEQARASSPTTAKTLLSCRSRRHLCIRSGAIKQTFGRWTAAAAAAAAAALERRWRRGGLYFFLSFPSIEPITVI